MGGHASDDQGAQEQASGESHNFNFSREGFLFYKFGEKLIWSWRVFLLDEDGFVLKSLFYFHFHEDELGERIARLVNEGFVVRGHSEVGKSADLSVLPEAFVISLDRLPSHGRAYAEWVWAAKKRQHIPIMFVGGKEDKVEAMKLKFPTAIYCSGEDLISVLKGLEDKI